MRALLVLLSLPLALLSVPAAGAVECEETDADPTLWVQRCEEHWADGNGRHTRWVVVYGSTATGWLPEPARHPAGQDVPFHYVLLRVDAGSADRCEPTGCYERNDATVRSDSATGIALVDDASTGAGTWRPDGGSGCRVYAGTTTQATPCQATPEALP